jgi:hypothetical protein
MRQELDVTVVSALAMQPSPALIAFQILPPLPAAQGEPAPTPAQAWRPHGPPPGPMRSRARISLLITTRHHPGDIDRAVDALATAFHPARRRQRFP